MDLQMKEETEVVENPELLESGPLRPAQEAAAALLPKEAQVRKENLGSPATIFPDLHAVVCSPSHCCLNLDINELNLPKTCDISFSDPDDLLNFKLVICPDEVGQGYPHDPPKVKCETMVYHPNIDLEGNVCLNILREDWKPVLTINSIIYGLQYLFLEPNPEDPLNKEAAEVLQNNRRLFEQNVQRSMRGGYIGSTYFERCLK
ncbi:NEDD8-conjugating enzyme Ubc12 [Cricetulus griseus]|uniref:NEDD8-conjugating enzyme UBC12 n=1 Tax=Cricetulus griseus TaxID=10029 RepID=G3I2Q4_CRIGR|nr:NEDD8-conjugating enzyme Ubc12 [Cricetulus griseus]